jgi:beta-glucanase (GH16 family)
MMRSHFPYTTPLKTLLMLGILGAVVSCKQAPGDDAVAVASVEEDPSTWRLTGESFHPERGVWAAADPAGPGAGGSSWTLDSASGSLLLDLNVPVTGRYRLELYSDGPAGHSLWLEDYIHNPDGRTYNLTGSLGPAADAGPKRWQRDGLPLDTGLHAMRLHVEGLGTRVDSMRFRRMVRHHNPVEPLVQAMDGSAWELVWSDEFDRDGLPDSTKWTWAFGDWGWGNHEAQYYTVARPENARVEDGLLVIEARKDWPSSNADSTTWSSARLTTRGKQSFTRGKIVIRAQAAPFAGCWAAGWTLGEAYRDELSWPYCGEIDILESVGWETDNETGAGKAHASVHTRAYYFKQGNHLTSTIDVDDISTEFHEYAVVWDRDSIAAYIDDTHYFTYAQKESEWAWPFDEPQNIIINLAMGGGWGGAIEGDLQEARYLIDYVRVYDRR